jgi:hypothetical protein
LTGQRYSSAFDQAPKATDSKTHAVVENENPIALTPSDGLKTMLE